MSCVGRGRIFFAGLVVLALCSCQSAPRPVSLATMPAPPGTQPATAPASNDLLCPDCKECGHTSRRVIRGRVYEQDRVLMTCPYCRSKWPNFLAAGKYEHVCSECGQNVNRCPLCRDDW